MDSDKPGKLEEREQRQNAEQQHGDTFAVASDEPTDTTSGIPTDVDEEADEADELPAARAAWTHYSVSRN
jgi:hypothetical protein